MGTAESGARSVIVFVSDNGREYVGTAGSSRPSADQRFRVGSVTKSFTATIVLQLAEEGRLRLGDTLDEHLPGVVPQGDEMTIRHLLGHRSGLVNVTEYESWLQRVSRSSSTRPISTLRFAASHPLDFAPGSRWSYSNTNYIALGLIIEKVTGQQYAHGARGAPPRPARARSNRVADDAASAGSGRCGRESESSVGGRLDCLERA